MRRVYPQYCYSSSCVPSCIIRGPFQERVRQEVKVYAGLCVCACLHLCLLLFVCVSRCLCFCASSPYFILRLSVSSLSESLCFPPSASIHLVNLSLSSSVSVFSPSSYFWCLSPLMSLHKSQRPSSYPYSVSRFSPSRDRNKTKETKWKSSSTAPQVHSLFKKWNRHRY